MRVCLIVSLKRDYFCVAVLHAVGTHLNFNHCVSCRVPPRLPNRVALHCRLVPCAACVMRKGSKGAVG